MILSRKFYQRDTLKVARELLGCVLVRKINQKIIKAVITETEAYRGENDLASHASKGRTPRTELMYGEAGQAYIYLIYGMYYCLNIVTEKKDYPAAVLIRAVKVEDIDYKKTNGPGKVCRELKIDKKLNGWNLTEGRKIWIATALAGSRLGRGKTIKKNIVAGRRIGVDYAKHCREYLWRFALTSE
jgi:DNA-3-methyladenine glycosylase